MILAPVSDPILRTTIRRAALPEEDVLHRLGDVQDGLRLGFPRLLVFKPEDRFILGEVEVWESRVATLALTRPTVEAWEASWRAHGIAVSRIDDSAIRLRALMRSLVPHPTWVDGTLADLTMMLGRGLPTNLRGLARRVMEYPSRYSNLSDFAPLTDLTPGALKARFRRRGLPSPVLYLRWFRLVAASHLLSDLDMTIREVSYRMGFSSDGNFCRWIQHVSGRLPSSFREPGASTLLLLKLAQECFPPGILETWDTLGGLFLRDVA